MSDRSVVLAIEASQRRGGVAVRDRSHRSHVELIGDSCRHDDDLLPAVERLYDRVGLRPEDTGVVGVSIGPGGFTGLRIAVSAAKMLAEALPARLVAVPSALVVAERAPRAGPILVALASKADTAWVTRLQRDEQGHWTVISDGLVEGPDLPLPGVEALYADRYLPASMRDACGRAGVAIEEPTFEPEACLQVARRLADRGRFTDSLSLSPLYARPPSAVTAWRDRSEDR